MSGDSALYPLTSLDVAQPGRQMIQHGEIFNLPVVWEDREDGVQLRRVNLTHSGELIPYLFRSRKRARRDAVRVPAAADFIEHAQAGTDAIFRSQSLASIKIAVTCDEVRQVLRHDGFVEHYVALWQCEIIRE